MSGMLGAVGRVLSIFCFGNHRVAVRRRSTLALSFISFARSRGNGIRCRTMSTRTILSNCHGVFSGTTTVLGNRFGLTSNTITGPYFGSTGNGFVGY